MDCTGLVLIVCANYNHGNWISDCIESIRAQTHKNWVLVIADDRSTDNSVSVLKQEVKKDQRIQVIQLRQNRGAYVARNTAIEAMSDVPWTHLTFIDPDDVANENWLKHSLESIGDRNLAWFRPLLTRVDESLSRRFSTYHGYCQTLFTRDAWTLLGGFLDVRISGDAEIIERLKGLSQLHKPQEFKEFFAFQPCQKCRLHSDNASNTRLKERKMWLESRTRELQKMRSANDFKVQATKEKWKAID